MSWFEVDKEGLATLMRGRDQSFVVSELLQNAWDEDGVTRVDVRVEPVPGRRAAVLTVIDNSPIGFVDLRESFTLFAPSKKASDATKRGRFNLGEKLVLALAETAEIVSMNGGFRFDEHGRNKLRRKLTRGTSVQAIMPWSRADIAEIEKMLCTMIPPEGIDTTYNECLLDRREPVATVREKLLTVDEHQRSMRRECDVHLYKLQKRPITGETETPMIYEMGIPVVESGTSYHVNVMQKVPLNMQRDNVRPVFRRDIEVLVLNSQHAELSFDEIAEPWVRTACKQEKVDDVAIQNVVRRRYGDNAVTYDPSDREANRLSVSQGRAVIHGSSLSSDEWRNLKRANDKLSATAVGLPAGRVTPSPKPYSKDGRKLELTPRDEWTPGEEQFKRFACWIARELLNKSISVRFADDADWGFAGTYGDGQLTVNTAKVRVDQYASHCNLDFLIHELAHEYGGHLTESFDAALSRIGAGIVRLAIEHPAKFEQFEESHA